MELLPLFDGRVVEKCGKLRICRIVSVKLMVANGANVVAWNTGSASSIRRKSLYGVTECQGPRVVLDWVTIGWDPH